MSQSGRAYDDQDYADELEIPRTSASFRVPRRRPGIDRTTRNMALVAGGIAVVIGLGVGVQAMLRPHGLPVVAADGGPWRVKPANPGGMHVTGTGNAIYNGTRPSGEDKAMPGPEKPDLAALTRDEHAHTAAAPAAVPTPPAETAQAATPAPATSVSAAAIPASPIAARPAPAARPVPAAPPAAARAVAAPGRAQVQLAALPTEAAARSEWRLLAHRMPTLLGHRAPLVTRAKVNGHTWWRLRTGGFASLAAARDFCAQVKAKGGACAVEKS